MSRTLAGLIAGLLLQLMPSCAARAQDAAGDWIGTVAVPPSQTFRVAIHIKKTPSGAYSGTYDSLDRGVYDAPLTDVEAAPTRLSFKVPRAFGSYLARWDAASRTWVGHWTLAGRSYSLDLARGAYPPAPTIAGLDGEWDGALNMGPVAGSLRLAFHIESGPHGTIGTYDSVDQGVYGGAVSSVSRQGDHVRLEMKAIGAVYGADLLNDGETLRGVFNQGGMRIALLLNRLPPGAPSPWPAPAATAPAPPPTHWKTPTDDDIRKMLVQRIDVGRRSVGIVVGVIDPSGRRIVAYGRSDAASRRPLGGDTEFEIGSITKVFTALVLADMVERGEVKLDDPASKYLPAGVTMPTRDGKAITLVELATHTSGLPRLPTNMAPRDPSNPYADYSVDQLYRFLSSYQLPRDPGARWEYSNLGFGLLGNLLSRRAGMDYQALVKARVLKPLGMASTTIALSADEAQRLAVGHDVYLRRVANWDLPTLAGAGALRSTANDLLTFLAANLGYADTPLKQAMAMMLTVRRPSGSPGMAQALGWEVSQSPAGEIVSHGGGTGGYATLIAFDPKTRVGVVALTNAEGVGASDIAMHILTGSPVAKLPPPAPPPPERHAISLDARALEALVGRYAFSPQASITITRDGDHLFAQITGQAAYEIFPQSPTDFFWKIVDAQATFQLGADGHAVALVIHQNGGDQPAHKVGYGSAAPFTPPAAGAAGG